MNRVSIYLSSYNHAKYLRESIDSVLNQTYSDFELFIVDDASDDESWFIIQSYTDPRIRSFRNKINRNNDDGIREVVLGMATGEYIAIHHSDDIWEPEKLQKQVDYLDAQPEFGAVFTNAQIIDEAGKRFKDKSNFYYKIFNQPNRNRFEWLNFFFYQANALCHPSVLIRKTCYTECGFYREGLNQIDDFDMWVRLCLKYEIHVIPEKLVRFRIQSNETNVSGNRPDSRIRWQFEMLQVLDNYLKIPTYQELVKIFPAAQKYYRQDGFDIGYVLARVALETQKDNPIFNLFGLKLLFNALNDPVRAKCINEYYGFTQKDFIALTAKHDIFSIELKPNLFSQLAEREQAVRSLSTQVSEKEQVVQSLTDQVAEKEQVILSFQNQAVEYEQQAVKLQDKLVEGERNIHSLQTKLKKYENDFIAVQAKAVEYEQHIKGMEDQLEEQNYQVSTLGVQKSDLEQELANLKDYQNQREQILQDLNSKLLEIYSSTAWKIIQLMWKVRLRLFPKGSHRERAVKRVIQLFSQRRPTRAGEDLHTQNLSSQSKGDRDQPGRKQRSTLFQRQPKIIAPIQSTEALKYQEIYGRLLVMAHGDKELEYVRLSDSDLSQEELPVKLIAFYLPQYHPIPENDEHWGLGFTEWTNVSKAVPQFLGHYQPRLPGELGFYDLRLPEVLARQVELAKKYGIYGFCIHYYWFSGRKVLDRPLKQFASNPSINFPFCICWANENWTRRWDGKDDDVLIEQVHSLENDYMFIQDLEPVLRHPNYIKVDNRPLIIVYRINLLNDPIKTGALWREYCIKAGLGNPYLVAAQTFGFVDASAIGFDAAIEFPPNSFVPKNITHEVTILNHQYTGNVFSYPEMVRQSVEKPVTKEYRLIKTVTPSWDNEPRKPGKGDVYFNFDPNAYREWLKYCIGDEIKRSPINDRFVFINAWNEWGESAYLEPDRKFGYAYLQATADALKSFNRVKLPSDWTILFVSHDACVGGAQKVLLNIISWFKAHTGAEIRLLCLDGGELYDDFKRIVDTLDLSSLSGETSETQLARIEEFCGGIPDLIYANTVVSAKAFSLLSKLGSPILTHIHELRSSIERYSKESLDDLRKYSTGYLTCSNAGRKHLIEEYGISQSSCWVAYSFIQPSDKLPLDTVQKRIQRTQLGLKNEKKLIFGCGIGMPFRKGADLFINVAQILRDRYKNTFHFYWIGEFSPDESHPEHGYWKEYLELIQANGLMDFVTFLGFKENPEDYLLAADIFLLPSREDPFPLVVMEAAQFELPIITFDGNGGAPEFVGNDAGILVPFEDTHAMAEAIIRLVDDDHLRSTFGRRAREKLFERFTIDKVAPSILSICRNVANKKPAVSIIVPNYNHAKYMPERLYSIFNQSFRDFELIILDDCSTDNSIEVIENYTEFGDVHVIKNTVNSGSPFKQWLEGIKRAKAEIIWIAESDDRCEPNFLEVGLKAFENPEIKLFYSNSWIINETGEVSGDYQKTDYLASLSTTKWNHNYQVTAEKEINEGLGIKNTILNISATLHRKSDLADAVLDNLGKMKYAGDWYFIINAIKGGEVYYDARKLNYHRRHSESVIGKLLAGNAVEDFYHEIELVQRTVIDNYNILDPFLEKWQIYHQKQWEEFFPGRDFLEFKNIFPYEDIQDILLKCKKSN